jgi:hypothetical protein
MPNGQNMASSSFVYFVHLLKRKYKEAKVDKRKINYQNQLYLSANLQRSGTRLYYFCQILFLFFTEVPRTTAAVAKQVTPQAELQKLATAISCGLPYGFQGSSQHQHIIPSLTTPSFYGTYNSRY